MHSDGLRGVGKRIFAFSEEMMLGCLMLFSGLVNLGFSMWVEEIDIATDLKSIEIEGYLVETHTVETSDGYRLCMHRLNNNTSLAPENLKSTNMISNVTGKPVVFLMHGLMGSSYIHWMSPVAKHPWAQFLADCGFDVWMGNNRGSRLSQSHRNLSNDTDAFWDFTWDEMAMYDLPALLEYTLQETHVESLAYIGYSQGTTQAFAGFSIHPELSKHVHLFIALAPVVGLEHVASDTFKRIGQLEDLLGSDKHFLMGDKEFPPFIHVIREYGIGLCQDYPSVCSSAASLKSFFTLAADDTGTLKLNHFNETILINMALPRLEETSIKNLIHWTQATLSHEFRMFDYSTPEANMAHYNMSVPPMYPLASMEVNTVLLSGDADGIADPLDVDWIAHHIPKLVEARVIANYTHDDFTFSDTNSDQVFPLVYDYLTKLRPASPNGTHEIVDSVLK